MDREVALEALGVLCNATVTSVQRPGVGLKAADISGASAPELMTIHDLVHRVLDGDAFRPVREDVSAGILSPEELGIPEHRLSVGTDEDSRGAGILSPEELGIPELRLCISTDEGSRGAVNRILRDFECAAFGLSGGTDVDILQELVKPVYKLAIDTDKDSKGNLQLVVDKEEFFDPRFDYDFTNITDNQTFYRGGEKYERPCGWKRFALKVLGKYDKDTWLGNNHRKTQSVAGEWPVSYHGTSQYGAERISEENYNMEKAKREKYGWGVYSTPDISVAERYTKIFQSKKTGKWYKVVLQNRINPEYREKYNHDKYWLVKIPKGTSKEEEKEMVDRAIRPYGLLLKEI